MEKKKLLKQKKGMKDGKYLGKNENSKRNGRSKQPEEESEEMK